MGLTANTGPYNAAAEHYGADDSIMSKIPRKKFQFSVEITINESVILKDSSYGRSFTFHRVQGVNLPDYSYNTTTVNQYNRLRHVHTRIEPTAAAISFYDTVDNQWQYLMESYAQHYGHGHSVSQGTIIKYDTVLPEFDGTFGLNAVPTEQRYFFPKIKIISHDTRSSKRSVTMYNCMISQVQHDRLDYSDSAPVLWQVQLMPEQVNFETGNESNGSQSIGIGAPTQAYNVAKSAAAGVLVNAAGEGIKDGVGRAIPLGNVDNRGPTNKEFGQPFVRSTDGTVVTDKNGNPVLSGTPNFQDEGQAFDGRPVGINIPNEPPVPELPMYDIDGRPAGKDVGISNQGGGYDNNPNRNPPRFDVKKAYPAFVNKIGDAF